MHFTWRFSNAYILHGELNNAYILHGKISNEQEVILKSI